MNKTRSVRIPVTDALLKELRQKADSDDTDIANATRHFWRDWIAGNIEIQTITKNKQEQTA